MSTADKNHPCTFGEPLGPGWAGCTHQVPRQPPHDLPKVKYRGSMVTMSRPSTVAKAADPGDPTPLMRWLGGLVLTGAVDHREYIEKAAAILSDPTADPAEKKHEIAELAVELATFAGYGKAAEAGTDQHAETICYLLTGEHLSETSGMQRRSAEATREALERRGFRTVFGEQFVVLGAEKVAGSYDLLVQHESSAKFYVADLKTSAKENDKRYPVKVSVQTACYARGRRYCPRTEEFLVDPPVDRSVALLISAPTGTDKVSIDPIDIETGWQGLTIAMAARSFGKERPLLSWLKAGFK